MVAVKTLENSAKYVPVETLEKDVKHQSSGVFIIDFEHISDLFLGFYCSLRTDKYLSGTSFLCKYYYPKSKDEQMLYSTSFKIAPNFLNNYIF